MSTGKSMGNVQLGGRGILAIEPNELSAPIEVLIELTWRCNLKCMHCMMNASYDESLETQPGELSLSELKDLVDQWSDMGVVHLDLSGGEPLLRTDIYELVAYANTKNLKSCLLSNGTLITDESAKKLKDADIYKVELNLDGPNAAVYDAFRGVKGAFDKTISAVKTLVDKGIPLRVNTMFCKFIHPHFRETIELAARLGIKEVCLSPLRIAGQTLNNYEQLVFSPLEYGEVLPEVINLKIEMEEKYGVLVLFHGDEEINKYINPRKIFPNCGAGRLHCTIGADGSVRPCPAFPTKKEFIAGNVREKDFATIWNEGEIFKKLRNPDIPGCRECEFAECVGGCRVQAYWKYGDVMGGPDPYCNKLITRKIKEELCS